MANYATLKTAIAEVIKTNGANAITGALLQSSLLSIIDSLGAGYQYIGVATPSTNPGTPDQNLFYIASTAGTYVNFGGLVLADGEIAILKYNGAWSKDSTGAASLEIVNQLGQDLGKVKKGVVNLNAVLGNTTAYTLADAIAAVPTEYRNMGAIITFRLVNNNNKNVRYQFNAAIASDSNWNNLSYWRNLDEPVGEIASDNLLGVSGKKVYEAITDPTKGFIDTTPTASSTKLLQSGGFVSAVGAGSVANSPVFTDETLKKGDGNKLVRSRGVYDAVQLTSDLSLILELGGIGNTGQNGVGAARMRTKFYLKAPFKVVLNNGYEFNSLNRYTIGNNNDVAFVDKTTISGSSLDISDAAYVYRIVLKRTDDADTQASDLNAAISTYASHYDLSHAIRPANWMAMGDSITYGWYSYFDENQQAQSAYDTSLGWAAQVAKITGKPITLRARPSAGYTATKNGQAVCAREDVDRIISYGLLDNIDLVTIAYGVNDWDDDCVLGSMSDAVSSTNTNIIPSMRYVIERLLATKPDLKIIIIMPINCAKHGNKAGNYGIGYAMPNNGTLEDIYDAFKTVCEYYGVEYIDMLHNSVVNRENILSLLPDKVHPSLEGHMLIARELAMKINCY